MLPKPSKNQPGTSPNVSKSMKNRARARLGQHLAAKRRPRAPNMRPRGDQEAPKSAQERPKRGQEPPKRHPGGAQTPPKSTPVRSRTSFSGALSRELCSRGCRVDFCSFFVSRAGWPTCVSYWFFQYETPLGLFLHYRLACTKKPRKIRPWDLQNPPRTLQNRVRGAPRRTKTG